MCMCIVINRKVQQYCIVETTEVCLCPMEKSIKKVASLLCHDDMVVLIRQNQAQN